MKTLTSIAFFIAMLAVPTMTISAHAATPPACTVLGPNVPGCVTAPVNTNSGVTGFQHCDCPWDCSKPKHPTT